MASQIDYAKLGPLLVGAIERLKQTLPEALVLVRYMPMCQLPGYE